MLVPQLSHLPFAPSSLLPLPRLCYAIGHCFLLPPLDEARPLRCFLISPCSLSPALICAPTSLAVGAFFFLRPRCRLLHFSFAPITFSLRPTLSLGLCTTSPSEFRPSLLSPSALALLTAGFLYSASFIRGIFYPLPTLRAFLHALARALLSAYSPFLSLLWALLSLRARVFRNFIGPGSFSFTRVLPPLANMPCLHF